MKDTLTIRIDTRTSRMLARVARLSRRAQSLIARDALRRQLAIELLDRLRERVLPFAEARGLLTDEDVFEAIGTCSSSTRRSRSGSSRLAPSGSW